MNLIYNLVSVINFSLFRYDPHATQFINFSQLSDFIASLDSPLGIPKPNILALVSFDLPIAKGDKIHCLDVLHSLTKYTLGFVDDGDEDFGKVRKKYNKLSFSFFLVLCTIIYWSFLQNLTIATVKSLIKVWNQPYLVQAWM